MPDKKRTSFSMPDLRCSDVTGYRPLSDSECDKKNVTSLVRPFRVHDI